MQNAALPHMAHLHQLFKQRQENHYGLMAPVVGGHYYAAPMREQGLAYIPGHNPYHAHIQPHPSTHPKYHQHHHHHHHHPHQSHPHTTFPSPSPNPHPHPSPLQQYPTPIRKERKKYAPNACTNCRNLHLSCDVVRPCPRCVASGKSDCCVTVYKKRGRPTKSAQMAAAAAAAKVIEDGNAVGSDTSMESHSDHERCDESNVGCIIGGSDPTPMTVSNESGILASEVEDEEEKMGGGPSDVGGNDPDDIPSRPIDVSEKSDVDPLDTSSPKLSKDAMISISASEVAKCAPTMIETAEKPAPALEPVPILDAAILTTTSMMDSTADIADVLPSCKVDDDTNISTEHCTIIVDDDPPTTVVSKTSARTHPESGSGKRRASSSTSPLKKKIPGVRRFRVEKRTAAAPFSFSGKIFSPSSRCYSYRSPQAPLLPRYMVASPYPMDPAMLQHYNMMAAGPVDLLGSMSYEPYPSLCCGIPCTHVDLSNGNLLSPTNPFGHPKGALDALVQAIEVREKQDVSPCKTATMTTVHTFSDDAGVPMKPIAPIASFSNPSLTLPAPSSMNTTSTGSTLQSLSKSSSICTLAKRTSSPSIDSSPSACSSRTLTPSSSTSSLNDLRTLYTFSSTQNIDELLDDHPKVQTRGSGGMVVHDFTKLSAHVLPSTTMNSATTDVSSDGAQGHTKLPSIRTALSSYDAPLEYCMPRCNSDDTIRIPFSAIPPPLFTFAAESDGGSSISDRCAKRTAGTFGDAGCRKEGDEEGETEEGSEADGALFSDRCDAISDDIDGTIDQRVRRLRLSASVSSLHLPSSRPPDGEGPATSDDMDV